MNGALSKRLMAFMHPVLNSLNDFLKNSYQVFEGWLVLTNVNEKNRETTLILLNTCCQHGFLQPIGFSH